MSRRSQSHTTLSTQVSWDHLRLTVNHSLKELTISMRCELTESMSSQPMMPPSISAASQLNHVALCMLKYSLTCGHYLGHIVSKNGIAVDPEKTRAIYEYPRPKDTPSIRAFLGLSGYYRDDIQIFSALAEPLYRCSQRNSDFEWTPNQEFAFEYLKQLLVTAPILSGPDYSAPFTITTDACHLGIGAVLEQPHGVVEYASRIFTPAEKNYSTTQQEMLGVVWACQKFHYIYDQHVVVYTDHQALKSLMDKRFDNSTGARGRLMRWIEELSEQDIEIRDRRGKNNGCADGLSRGPVQPSALDYMYECSIFSESNDHEQHIRVVSAEEPGPIPTGQHEARPHEGQTGSGSHSGSSDVPEDERRRMELMNLIRSNTRSDPLLSKVLTYVKDHKLPDDESARTILLECETLVVDGDLVRKVMNDGSLRIMIPHELVTHVIEMIHRTPHWWTLRGPQDIPEDI